jgi:hypothetical protein
VVDGVIWGREFCGGVADTIWVLDLVGERGMGIGIGTTCATGVLTLGVAIGVISGLRVDNTLKSYFNN